MNNDICPAGTWDLLAHLGYSRADVERIAATRTFGVMSGRPLTVGPGDMTRAMQAAEIEGKELLGGSLSGILLPLHASAPGGCKCADCTINQEACPTCYAAWWVDRHPNTVLVESHDPATVQACLDAVNGCITKGQLSGDGWDQTAQRNGLILASNLLSSMLPERLEAAPKPADQEELWQGIADSFYADGAPRADRRCGMWDAKPMPAEEVRYRRFEGYLQHEKFMDASAIADNIMADLGAAEDRV